MRDEHMSDADFRAMIQLLDDDDSEVTVHVWERLIQMGKDGLNRLELVWEGIGDPKLQAILEEVIHRLQVKGVSDDLLAWRKGGGSNLLRGWYLGSRIQYPDLDFQICRNDINRLVNKIWLEMGDFMGPQEKLGTINQILFTLEGYGLNSRKPEDPNNFYLNYLLKGHQGNLFSTTLLYLVICEELDFPVKGVLIPGYFFLLYQDRDQPFYIDVLNHGKFFSRERLEEYLKQVNLEPKSSYFKPTSNIYILLSWLKNLALAYSKADRKDKEEEIEQILRDIEIKF